MRLIPEYIRYSFVQLFIDLLKCKTTTCGTISVNRKGISIQMNASNKKKGERETVIFPKV